MPGAADYLDSLGTWSYSIITAMELFAGAENKKEIQRLEKFLRDFREVQLSADDLFEVGRDRADGRPDRSDGDDRGADPRHAQQEAFSRDQGFGSGSSQVLSYRARGSIATILCRTTEFWFGAGFPNPEGNFIHPASTLDA